VPAVVRRLEEHRLPELLMAAGARDLDVSHTAAAPGRLPGRLAEAWFPADLRLAGPQLVTERTGFRLVLEQRSGHLNDHCLTGCHESMTIVTCTEDRYRDPDPCRVTAQQVWCSIAACRSGCDALHLAQPQRSRGRAEGTDRPDPREAHPLWHQCPQHPRLLAAPTTASRPTCDATALTLRLCRPPRPLASPHKIPVRVPDPPPQVSHGHDGIPRHTPALLLK
jgi:hypothetical protein